MADDALIEEGIHFPGELQELVAGAVGDGSGRIVEDGEGADDLGLRTVERDASIEPDRRLGGYNRKLGEALIGESVLDDEEGVEADNGGAECGVAGHVLL